MKYFGVPTCPYCRKRVNLIRSWSLKRQGEYQCPRCGGISNIFLSPLIYVAALVAVFAGGAVYFFHKFILEDISLSIVFQVILPFALFFVLSLFMVYLAKPVIKKVPKTEPKRQYRRPAAPDSRRAALSAKNGESLRDQGEYLPQGEYQTGTFLLPDERTVPQRQSLEGPARTVPAERRQPVASQQSSVNRTPETRPSVNRTPANRVPANRAPAERASREQAQASPSRASLSQASPSQASPSRASLSQASPSQASPSRASLSQASPSRANPSRASLSQASRPSANQASVSRSSVHRETVRETSAPAPSTEARASLSNAEFFAKYDDPEYVKRRLQELNDQKGRRE